MALDQDRDRVAIGDPDDAAGEGLGVGMADAQFFALRNLLVGKFYIFSLAQEGVALNTMILMPMPNLARFLLKASTF